MLTIVINMTIMSQRGEWAMKRFWWLLYSLLSLGIGALMYVFYRQDTYIGGLIGEIISVSLPIHDIFSAFAAWYFPDFLWMFSLTCALFSIMLPKGKNLLLWCCVAFFMGALWEFLQWRDVVSGTADWWDVILYSMAVILAAIIEILFKKGKKK